MITGTLLQSLIKDHASSTAIGKTPFYPGQYAKGRVLQVLPNQHAIFQIEGMKVLAKVEMDLTVGDHVWLQVKAAGQPTEFKLVSKWAQPKGVLASPTDGLQELTRSLGIAVNPQEKELMAKMIENKLPVTPRTWDTVSSAFRQLGQSQEGAELLLLAMKKGYPLTKEVLHGLKTFLQGTGLYSMVQSYRQELQSVVQQHTNLPSQDLTTMKSLDSLLSKLTSTLQPEQFDSDGILQGLKSVRDLDTLQTELLKWKAASPDFLGTVGLREKTDGLLQFITGQQTMLQSPETVLGQLILHIPLKPFGERAFVQMEGKRKDKGEIDPENCRLLFYLDLTNLGDVIMDIRIVKSVVSMEVYGNAGEALFQEYKYELQEDLKRVGYHLSHVKINHKDRKENGVSHQSLSSSYRGVDVRI